MKSHENLPALNKYTSRVQYDALLEIDKTHSILTIVMNGASSKTLGALVRSMWIKQKDYTDESGVIREGWFVTDEGKHAMNVYKVKFEQEQEQKRKFEERVNKFEQFLVKFIDLSQINKPKIALLREQIAELEKEIYNVNGEVIALAKLIPQYEQNKILDKHKLVIKSPYKEPIYRKNYDNYF
jgi:uncharacterized UPF0160 family protein